MHRRTVWRITTVAALIVAAGVTGHFIRGEREPSPATTTVVSAVAIAGEGSPVLKPCFDLPAGGVACVHAPADSPSNPGTAPTQPVQPTQPAGTMLVPGACMAVLRGPSRLTLDELTSRLGSPPGTTHLFVPEIDLPWWEEDPGVLRLPPRFRATERAGAWVLWAARGDTCTDEAWLRRVSAHGVRVVGLTTAPERIAVAVDGRVTDLFVAEDLADEKVRLPVSPLLRPYLPQLRKGAEAADLAGAESRVLQELGGVRLDAAWLRGPMWAVEGARS